MRAIFEISGGEDHEMRTGASATGADEEYKAACAALMRLLPAHRQHSRNLLQGKCRFITCRRVDQTQPMAVVFFRQVRHTSTDEGGYVIEGIGTEEQSRGNGIGTALLRRVIATAVQECGQGGNPRTYIGSVANAAWWLSRMGMCRADERWGLERGKGNFAMVWNPTDADLCEPCLYSEIQWTWRAQPIHNPSNWCHLISILQLLLAATAFTDLIRGARWPRYGVGHTIWELMAWMRDDSVTRGYGPKGILRSGQLLLRLWSSLCRRLPHLVRKEGMKEEERDVQETLDAILQALQDEQAEQNPAEAILRPPFGHDLWSSQISWRDRCTKCQTERQSTDGQWTNYLMIEVNEGTGDLLHRLHHPMVETLQYRFGGCDCSAPIERTPVVDSTKGLVLILVGRAAQEHQGVRLGEEVPCPLTMALNTSQGTRQLECIGVVAHGASESCPYKGAHGRDGVLIQHGHFVAIINRSWGSRPTAILLSDSQKSIIVGNDSLYCPLEPLERILPDYQSFVEVMALYRDTDQERSTHSEHDVNTLLRNSLATLGIAVQEVQRGNIVETDGISRGTVELSNGATKEITAPSLQEPVQWVYQVFSSDAGPMDGARLDLDTIEPQLPGAKLWKRPLPRLVRAGHTGSPMLSPLPTVCWTRRVQSIEQAGKQVANDTNLLLFSCSDLRNLDIETGLGDSDIDFNQLVWQLRRRGKAAGGALRCRVISLSEDSPMATWPADWICFVVGGRAAELGQWTLLITSWRPRTSEETATARGTLRNLAADERARQHLCDLQFQQPVMENAAAWLQNDGRRGAGEIEAVTGLSVSNSGTGNGDCATPVEEPMKSAGP